MLVVVVGVLFDIVIVTVTVEPADLVEVDVDPVAVEVMLEVVLVELVVLEPVLLVELVDLEPVLLVELVDLVDCVETETAASPEEDPEQGSVLEIDCDPVEALFAGQTTTSKLTLAIPISIARASLPTN